MAGVTVVVVVVVVGNGNGAQKVRFCMIRMPRGSNDGGGEEVATFATEMVV